MGCSSSKSPPRTAAGQQAGPSGEPSQGTASANRSGDGLEEDSVWGLAQSPAMEEVVSSKPPLDSGDSSFYPSASKSASSSPSNRAPGTRDEVSPAKLLRRLRKLCKEVRVLEAAGLLEELEKMVNDRNGESSISEAARSELQKELQSNPLIQKLRTCSSLLRTSLTLTLAPASRDDATWSSMTIRDPKISEDFYLDIGLRCAEGDEFDKNGPSLQIIAKGNAFNFPISLTRYLAMQREVDLAKKEWIKDCESIVGFTRSNQPFASLIHMVLAPALLPFRVQEMVVRSFCICPEAPASLKQKPGLLILESNPPDGATEYDGWQIPERRRRAVSAGTTKMFYAVPTGNGQINVLGAVRLGVPVPRWMVPLDLVKRFVADVFRESLKGVKEQVVDRWGEYAFDERMLASADFYKQANNILSTGAAQDSDDEESKPVEPVEESEVTWTSI